MTSTSPRRTQRGRAVRVPVAVVEIVASSWLAHVAAGGAAPGTEHLVAVVLLAVLASVAMRQRVVPLPVAVVGVLAGQLALHSAFSHAGGAGHGLSLLDPGMLLAHSGAAVVTAMALVWQEQLLVSAVDRLVPDLRPVVPAGVVSLHPTGARATAVGRMHRGAVRERGPPAGRLTG